MGFKYYRFIFTFFLILCLSSLYSVATRDGKQNALPLLQRKWYNEVRGAQVYLHKKRQICAKGGDQPHTDCHINSYLRRRLTEKHRCSQLDAHHIQNAFRLRMTFWKHCNKYSRLNTSVAHWVDKARAKELVERNVPELKVVKTLAVIYHPADIMAPGFLDKFPNSFVMKGTHGSQMTIVVNRPHFNCINLRTAKKFGHCLQAEFKSLQEALYKHCNWWLHIDFGALSNQQFYSFIQRGCIFEESLVDSEGNYPKDVKFFSGGGQLLAGRHYHNSPDSIKFQAADSLPDFSGIYLTNRSMCTADLSKYSAHEEWKGSKFQVAAEKLAKLFPYARIDFFDTDPPTFQEITFTPNNCQPNDQHHLFTAWVWGYIIFMRAHISPHCLAWINRLSLCDELIFRWLRSQVRPIDAKKGPIQ
eukprot:m.228502 g.228502  ORF g.228502 m.228502 type:complete len:416 (-) comp15979_c0_seq9:48-1295(-)